MSTSAPDRESPRPPPQQPAWYEFLGNIQVTMFSGTAALAVWSVVRAHQGHHGLFAPPAVALVIAPVLLQSLGLFETRFGLGPDARWQTVALVPLALVFAGPLLTGLVDTGYVMTSWPTLAGVLPFLTYHSRYRAWQHTQRARNPNNWQAIPDRVMRFEVASLAVLATATLCCGAALGPGSLPVAVASLVLPFYALAATSSWSLLRLEDKR